MQKKTPQDYQQAAYRKGINWTGRSTPQDTKAKTEWTCPSGHSWQATYNSVIAKDTGCPYCYRPTNKKKVEDYKDIERRYGLKWVGEFLPKDVNAKTEWLCPIGHVFSRSYHSITDSGNDCPCCPKSFQKTIDDYRNIRGKDGARWIGEFPPRDVTIKTEWTCDKSHIWRTTYKSIVLQNAGCPICKTSQGEYQIAATLDELGIEYTPQKTFPECRLFRMLPFDFYFIIKDSRFLVEYDGAQHFRAVKAFGGYETLKKNQLRDSVKDRFAEQNGYTLIRIPYSVTDIKTHLLNKLEEAVGDQFSDSTDCL